VSLCNAQQRAVTTHRPISSPAASRVCATASSCGRSRACCAAVSVDIRERVLHAADFW
jgi:hypothetical protein